MHVTLKQLEFVKNKINEIINRKQLKTKPKIIVVTKTFPLKSIIPLLKYGHIHYAENKIQEAEKKWIETNYRTQLAPEDLADPVLLDECRQALDELTTILKLGPIYDFQLN